jgi:hypothetical protein
LYGVLPFDGDSVFQIIGFLMMETPNRFLRNIFLLQKILKNLYSFSLAFSSYKVAEDQMYERLLSSSVKCFSEPFQRNSASLFC